MVKKKIKRKLYIFKKKSFFQSYHYITFANLGLKEILWSRIKGLKEI